MLPSSPHPFARSPPTPPHRTASSPHRTTTLAAPHHLNHTAPPPSPHRTTPSPGLWSKFITCLQSKRSEGKGKVEEWLGDGKGLAEVDEFLTDAVGSYDDLYKFLNESRFSSGMATTMLALRMKNKLTRKKSMKKPGIGGAFGMAAASGGATLSVASTKEATATGHKVTTVVTGA